MVLDGRMVLDGIGWYWMVLDSIGWFWMFVDGNGWSCLVVYCCRLFYVHKLWFITLVEFSLFDTDVVM